MTITTILLVVSGILPIPVPDRWRSIAFPNGNHHELVEFKRLKFSLLPAPSLTIEDIRIQHTSFMIRLPTLKLVAGLARPPEGLPKIVISRIDAAHGEMQLNDANPLLTMIDVLQNILPRDQTDEDQKTGIYPSLYLHDWRITTPAATLHHIDVDLLEIHPNGAEPSKLAMRSDQTQFMLGQGYVVKQLGTQGQWLIRDAQLDFDVVFQNSQPVQARWSGSSLLEQLRLSTNPHMTLWGENISLYIKRQLIDSTKQQQTELADTLQERQFAMKVTKLYGDQSDGRLKLQKVRITQAHPQADQTQLDATIDLAKGTMAIEKHARPNQLWRFPCEPIHLTNSLQQLIIDQAWLIIRDKNTRTASPDAQTTFSHEQRDPQVIACQLAAPAERSIAGISP